MEIGQFDDLIQYASQMADLALNIGFVLGPLIGYVAQYQLIKQQKSVGSFSTDVCAILLFANLLRIVFWYYYFNKIMYTFRFYVFLILKFMILFNTNFKHIQF